MSDVPIKSPVGYIDAGVVGQIRINIQNDGNGVLGLLDQMVYQCPDGSLGTMDKLSKALVQGGFAIAGAAAGSAIGATILGGVSLALAAPVAIVGAAASAFAGADNVSVTLIVVNATDQPLELVKSYTNWGEIYSEPGVMVTSGNAFVPKLAPNRSQGSDNDVWIDSATAAGMSSGSAAVGVWRFNQCRTVGISFVGTDGTIELKNDHGDYHLFVGGLSGYRSLFTSDDKNVAKALFQHEGKPKGPKAFYNKYLDGHDYAAGGTSDSVSAKVTARLTAAGNGAAPHDLVVTVLVE